MRYLLQVETSDGTAVGDEFVGRIVINADRGPTGMADDYGREPTHVLRCGDQDGLARGRLVADTGGSGLRWLLLAPKALNDSLRSGGRVRWLLSEEPDGV